MSLAMSWKTSKQTIAAGIICSAVYYVCLCMHMINPVLTNQFCAYLSRNHTVAEFKSFVTNNNAFGNVFCNSQKSFHNFATCSGPLNRGYHSFCQLNNSILIYKNIKVYIYDFVNWYAIVQLEEWSTASIIWVVTSAKDVKTLSWITEYITKSFVI